MTPTPGLNAFLCCFCGGCSLVDLGGPWTGEPGEETPERYLTFIVCHPCYLSIRTGSVMGMSVSLDEAMSTATTEVLGLSSSNVLVYGESLRARESPSRQREPGWYRPEACTPWPPFEYWTVRKKVELKLSRAAVPAMLGGSLESQVS